jgi:hypothetical protein
VHRLVAEQVNQQAEGWWCNDGNHLRSSLDTEAVRCTFRTDSSPSDSDWILKVFQAVTVWRAPRLVVRQSRLATSFFFCPPDSASFPTEGRLIQNLSAGVLDGEKPIAMLCMAIGGW